MTWRNHLALLLAVVLLVSASGAASLCVEADGTSRVELIGASCCDDTASTSPREGDLSFAPVGPCDGCEDRPLDETRWSRAQDGHDALLLAQSLDRPTAIAAAALEGPSPRSSRALVDPPPPPRVERPATLRC